MSWPRYSLGLEIFTCRAGEETTLPFNCVSISKSGGPDLELACYLIRSGLIDSEIQTLKACGLSLVAKMGNRFVSFDYRQRSGPKHKIKRMEKI